MTQLKNSAVYQGWVRHRRFSKPENHFTYGFYMFLVDLDELDIFNQQKYCSTDKFAIFSVKKTDYFDKNSNLSIKEKAIQKTVDLGGSPPKSVRMLANIRYWGIKFSPINIFYNYDEANQLSSVLVEVSNTPWNERHYYLIKHPHNPLPTRKNFHVSPFQTSQVEYHWRLKEPEDTLLFHIENLALDSHRNKLFDATLQLQRMPVTPSNLRQLMIQTPVMSLKIVAGIYWQAAKLALRKARFYPHPKTKKTGEPHV